jgi:hypothetical protein
MQTLCAKQNTLQYRSIRKSLHHLVVRCVASDRSDANRTFGLRRHSEEGLARVERACTRCTTYLRMDWISSSIFVARLLHKAVRPERPLHSKSGKYVDDPVQMLPSSFFKSNPSDDFNVILHLNTRQPHLTHHPLLVTCAADVDQRVGSVDERRRDEQS